MTDQPTAQHDTLEAEAWLDEFFAAYYAARPVNATFIGVHDHDHRLPDLTANGTGDVVSVMRDLLSRCPAGALPWFLDADLRLARGYLRTQLWEWESDHFRRGNPCVFTGEAIFGVMSLFLTDFAPLTDRVDLATSRLAAVPAFLASARKTIENSPVAWTERAIRECDGALAFLTDGVPLLLEPQPLRAAAIRRFEAAAETAAAAFARFRAWLDTELRGRSRNGVACGEEVLDLLIREGHCLSIPAPDIERHARVRLQEAVSYLAAHAADFGAATSAEALRLLGRLHPPLDHYYPRYGQILAEVRARAEAHDLLTWPDFPIRFVPQPDWARKAAPHLYFLFYRSPAAYGRPPVHDYLVTPIEESMPAEEQARLLRTTNDSVIHLNHVIHHGGIGHHIQNWHAFRSPSRVGRIAAVDCASRIAMFCGGTMAEGWACYATDLMAEHGALSPLERYAEVQSRARMCARAIVDVRLHQGRFSLADAVRFYEDYAGMSPAAANTEAVRNSMFPGTALMYLMGSDGIHELRNEIASIEGGRFSLRRFHDTLLSFGSIPVTMIAALMTGRALPGEGTQP